jgi:hypothetical protein
VQKDVTPGIPYSGQFIEHAGAEVLPNMFGAWKHVVWSYNATILLTACLLTVKNLIYQQRYKRYTNDPCRRNRTW